MSGTLRCRSRLRLGVLLLLGERLGRLLDVAAAGLPAAEDQALELLEQVLAHREVAGVLVLGLELERIALQVIQLPAAVRVLDEQVAAGPDRAVAGCDDRARDLG